MPPSRILLLFLFLTGMVNAVPLAERPARMVEMEGYTVISDASDRKIVAWVKDFDRLRRAGQRVAGVRDDQLLPLTLLLFSRRGDFLAMLPPGSAQLGALSVGLTQQPIIALDAETSGEAKDLNIRFAVLMWIMGSSGVPYDHWVLQGLYDMFGAAQISDDRIVLGKKQSALAGMLGDLRRQAGGMPFGLEQPAWPQGLEWLAVHYLLIGDHAWQGLAGILKYGRRVALGEPRALAFKAVFGLDQREMSIALDRYFRDGKFRCATLPGVGHDRMGKIVPTPAPPGLRELSLAQFILQTSGGDCDEARRDIESAEAVMPDDVRVQESWFLYGVRANESGLAMEALNKAVRLGSRNPALRLAWCFNTMTKGFQRGDGYLLPAPEAIELADTLAAVMRNNVDRMAAYSMLAQLMPSIKPARAEDRTLLEGGLAMAAPGNPVLEAGMAAWLWRAGRRDEAQARLQSVISQSDQLDAQVREFAHWLRSQIQGDTAADAAGLAVANRDYAEARRSLAELKPEYKLGHELAARVQELSRVCALEDLLRQAEALVAQGQPDRGRILLDEVSAGVLPPDLGARAQTLADKLEHLTAKTPAKAAKD
jgi:hypothetical protein